MILFFFCRKKIKMTVVRKLEKIVAVVNFSQMILCFKNKAVENAKADENRADKSLAETEKL